MEFRNYSRPLLPLTLSLITGLMFGLHLPGAGILSICISVALLSFLIVCCIRAKQLQLIPLFLFVITGYLMVQPYLNFKHGKNHITAYADGAKYQITGTVDSRPVKKNRCYRFVMNTETISSNEKDKRQISGRISVSAYGKYLSFKKGDRITFKSKIRRFRSFKNPGAFDYERFMAFKDIWASAYTGVKKIDVIHHSTPSPVAVVQTSIIKLISDNIENKDVQSVLKALIVGDKQSIRPELRRAFNQTGTGHLLAISGLHVGIVAAFSFAFFCFSLSFFTRLLWSGRIFCIAGLMALFPVVSYGLVAGMSPSTQRAVIMVSLFLFSYSLYAEYDLINTLVFSAFIILAVFPVSILSVSFQLSFSAVCAIAAGVVILNTGPENSETEKPPVQKLKTKLTSYFLISFLAYAGTLPIVIYYFNRISLIGLLANFILVPVIGFFVVPLGLLSVLISSISIKTGGLLITVTGFLLEKSLLLIQWLSDLPLASLRIVTPSMIYIVCYYVFFALLLYVIFKKKKGEKINQRGISAAVVMIFLMLIADTAFDLHKRFYHNSLRVTIIDVGQGSSVLLEFPNGKTMLIDGGGFNDNKSFDVGEKIIAPLLWKKRILTLDTVALTHPESDHLNGLLYIIENFNVKAVWSNGQKRRLAGYRTFQKIILEKKIQHLPFKDLNKNTFFDDVELEILYPSDDYSEKQKKEKWRNSNNNSLVMRVDYQGTSFLFPGDIMNKAEAELVRTSGEKLKTTVLLVPHHGSKTSTGKELIKAVQPEYAIVSAGWKNRFNMPHPSVLKRLTKSGAKIYRTDKDGAVLMTVKDHDFSIMSAL